MWKPCIFANEWFCFNFDEYCSRNNSEEVWSEYIICDGFDYQFELFTIVTMAYLHQGYSVALMITNRNDTEVRKLFLITTDFIGKINAPVFMNDIANELFKA